MRNITDKVDSLIEGTWSVDDIIEMVYDEMGETSTSGSVGSGTDRALIPTESDDDDERLKIKKLLKSMYKEREECYLEDDRSRWNHIVSENPQLSTGLVKEVRLELVANGYDL